MSTGYHEAGLSQKTQNIHRAIASLQEELEAVDWYNQRADVTEDAELKAVLEHNRNEEIEHAGMLLEYLRRNMSEFDEQLSTYLFSTLPITQIEEAEEGGENDAPGDVSSSGLGIGKMD